MIGDKNQQQIVAGQEQESSSLGFLNQNQNEEDADKESNGQNSKKRGFEQEKDSEIRKTFNPTSKKQKKLQNQGAYEGIYLYKPGVELPSLSHFASQSIKIIIASEYIKKHNPQLLKRNIYGTDPYTSNSDAVCILVHSGLININSFQNKKYQGVQLTCKVIKPKKNYTGSLKNALLSRSIKGYNGNALKAQSVKNLQSLGPMELLQRYASNMHIPIGKSRIRPKPKNISSIIPIPQTHIVFNMNNQPAYKYSIFNIADKGYDKNQFMIKKLDQMVLYLETQEGEKFQLLKKLQMDVFDVFRFSKLKFPQKCDNEYFTNQESPLSNEMIEVIYPNLDWNQIQWGNTSILLKKQKRVEGIKSFKFYKRGKELSLK